MKTIYIAFDGKQFDDEWECEKYERDFLKNTLKNSVKVFDSDLNEIIGDDLIDRKVEDYHIVCIKNKDGIKFIDNQYDDTGLCYLRDLSYYADDSKFPVCMMWSDDEEMWIDLYNVEDKYKYWENRLNLMNDLLNSGGSDD